ncbi:MAG: hypothetical protein HZB13_16645, partial [Acidobacteria bacterium]|nr:hypothetical protein [Acidobacteriota bacterium]
MRRLVALLLIAAFSCASARAGQRLRRRDIRAPAPLPRPSLLVIGFLGAWERWDNPKRSVRKLALSLRERRLPGVFVETAGNHDRATVLKFIREATRGGGKADVEVICYGQSFGGAACVKLARDLNKAGIAVRLTVQVDSVGRDD